MYEKELAAINQVIATGKYQAQWESLATYPVPQWYREAKFGAFIHWGAYAVPAYFSEWYVRLMYYHQNPVYWHHIRKYGKNYPYRKFIEQFTAPKFDAEQIVAALKAAGAKYIMPVGEHHDGLKLYDSDLSEWTTVRQAMHRDVLGEYRRACENQGVVFAASSHRAEHYWFVNGARTVGYETEALNPNYEELYGACVNVNRRNNLRTLLRQERGIDPTPEWCENWLVHTVEMVDRYQPETLFFDWWVSNHTFRPYLKNSWRIILIALWNGAKRFVCSIRATPLCITPPSSTGSAGSWMPSAQLFGNQKPPPPITHGAIARQTDGKRPRRSPVFLQM